MMHTVALLIALWLLVNCLIAALFAYPVAVEELRVRTRSKRRAAS